MAENPTNGDYCSDNITIEERMAYANYVTRCRKGMPGGMTIEEKKILDRFCGGEVRNLDVFFKSHLDGCAFCRRDYEEILKLEQLHTEDDGALEIRLRSDAANDGDGFDLFSAVKKMRSAGQKFDILHVGLGYEVELKDYLLNRAKGDGEENPEFEKHITDCEDCLHYREALVSMRKFARKDEQKDEQED